MQSREVPKELKEMHLFQDKCESTHNKFILHYSVPQMGLTTAQCRLTNPQFQNLNFIEHCKIFGP